MKISTNLPSKHTVPKSANAFAKKTLSAGSTDFSKKELERGTNGWEGENLTSTNPGLDFLEGGGVAPGLNEGGGIAHFKNRPDAPVTH